MDFDDLARFYDGWSIKVEQCSAGRYEGAVQLVRTPTIYVVEGTFSQSHTVRGLSNPAESVFYLVEPTGAGAVWWGRRLAPGHLVSMRPDTPADYFSARRCRTVGVSVPAARLAWATGGVLAADPLPVRGGWASVEPPPEAFATLARRLRRLMWVGLADPIALGGPDGELLEQECLRALVEAARTRGDHQPTTPPLSSRSRLVGQAEEFMRAHLRNPVGTIDLCATLGVSDRTLRQAFQERYGMGPMVYYKALRLNAVRAALKKTEANTVAVVARSWGFHHLGNFAADYRRAFGERPSETVNGE